MTTPATTYHHRNGTEVTTPVYDLNERLGRALTDTAETCYRCGGSGIYRWATIHGMAAGTCFHCGGTGKHHREGVKVYTAEKLAALDKAEAKRQAKREAAYRELRARLDAELESFKAAHADLLERARKVAAAEAAARQDGLGYVGSLLYHLDELGHPLTEGQLRALTTAVEREEAKAAAHGAAEAVPLTDERLEVTGEVLTVQSRPGYCGGSVLKVLVQDDRGFKVWGTLPTSLYEADRGDRVTFTATLERSSDDPKFGFFSRPTRAAILES